MSILLYLASTVLRAAFFGTGILIFERLFPVRARRIPPAFYWMLIIIAILPLSFINYNFEKSSTMEPATVSAASAGNSLEEISINDSANIIEVSEVKTMESIPVITEKTSLISNISLTNILIVLWIATGGIILLFRYIKLFRFTVKLAKLPEVDSKRFVRLFNESKKVLGIRRARLFDNSASDFVMPCSLERNVYLPITELEKKSDTEILLIMSHELAHVMNNHFIFQFANLMIMPFFFFNYFIVFLMKRECRATELQCDRNVLAAFGVVHSSFRETYSRLILENVSFHSGNLPVCGISCSISDTETRLNAIMIDNPFMYRSLLSNPILIFAPLAIIIAFFIPSGQKENLFSRLFDEGRQKLFASNGAPVPPSANDSSVSAATAVIKDETDDKTYEEERKKLEENYKKKIDIFEMNFRNIAELHKIDSASSDQLTEAESNLIKQQLLYAAEFKNAFTEPEKRSLKKRYIDIFNGNLRRAETLHKMNTLSTSDLHKAQLQAVDAAIFVSEIFNKNIPKDNTADKKVKNEKLYKAKLAILENALFEKQIQYKSGSAGLEDVLPLKLAVVRYKLTSPDASLSDSEKNELKKEYIEIYKELARLSKLMFQAGASQLYESIISDLALTDAEIFVNSLSGKTTVPAELIERKTKQLDEIIRLLEAEVKFLGADDGKLKKYQMLKQAL